MGRMQREKGKRGEREIVRLFRAKGIPAERTWETAQRGNAECDILIDGRPFQVKLRKSGFKQLYDAIESVDGVFLRQNKREWLVIFRLEDML